MGASRLSANYWKLFSATTFSSLGTGVSGVAFPWIASVLTRDPFVIALISLSGQLPWLIFTLPAGVLTDRLNKKMILIGMDVIRGLLTVVVGCGVFINRHSLHDIKDPASMTVSTQWGLILLIFAAQLVMGCASVLADNTSQTVMPAVVSTDQLQRANGRLWSAISVSEQFVGPPLGSFLLTAGAFIPFLFDASSFFASAGLIALIASSFHSSSEKPAKKNFTVELQEGFQWLWNHKLIRTLAISLGVFNLATNISMAASILFMQEVLHVKVFIFALLSTGFAIGGVVGGLVAPKIAEKLGEGRSLTVTLLGIAGATLMVGLARSWIVVWVAEIIVALLSTLWNVVTVSFRQSIIPPHLLGRVNSVYRFFGWGSLPLGSFLGGILVSIALHFTNREFALRLPWFVGAGIILAIYLGTRTLLTTSAFESARNLASDQG